VFNLFGLRLRFEIQIPEDVVDQVNNIFVQYENLLNYCSFDIVTGTIMIAIGYTLTHHDGKRDR
jgi:hypothetical protein